MRFKNLEPAQPAGAVTSELEAKLLVESESDLDDLARLTRLGTYRLQSQPSRSLLSTYLDTRDLTLTRHAVAVRLRRSGESWEATVKWAGEVRGMMHERPELNVSLAEPPQPSFHLPPELHVHLAALLAGRKLSPVLVTEIERRRIDVLDATAQHHLAEIALDRVLLRSPRKRDRRSERYFEVEIERKEGTADDVASITALLRRGRRMQPSQESKLGRGLGLLYGPTAIERTPASSVTASDSQVDAARKMVAGQLDRLLRSDPEVRLGTDPESLHSMRVAIRRLRALVRLLGASFPPRLHRELKGDLRWLGQLLGQVRDADVQLQRFEAHRRKVRRARRAALDPYWRYLDARRERSRAAMLEGLDSARYFALLRKLERFAQTSSVGAPSGSVSAAGGNALRRAYKGFFKRAAAIGKHPSADDLHDVRIRSKRLRYVCEFLAPLTGRAGRRFVKHMAALQDLLGTHNDAVVAAGYATRFLQEEPDVAETTRRAVTTFRRANEARAARARAALHRAWKHFTQSHTKRALAAILEVLR